MEHGQQLQEVRRERPQSTRVTCPWHGAPEGLHVARGQPLPSVPGTCRAGGPASSRQFCHSQFNGSWHFA